MPLLIGGDSEGESASRESTTMTVEQLLAAKVGPQAGLESADQTNDAAVTVRVYRNQGWRDVGGYDTESADLLARIWRNKGWLDMLRSTDGEVVGFWLGGHPLGDAVQTFLHMVAQSEKLDLETLISISHGDFRFLPNSFDQRGGHYVMIGSAKAPGEQIPPLTSVRWQKGQANPKSDRVALVIEGVRVLVRFACPTCNIPNYCDGSNIAEYVGVMVECENCGNVSHVPAAFKNATDTSRLEIRGCSYVPIAEFRDWFFAHPSFSLANADDSGSYGLWAYCARCKHRFASTVLPSFVTSMGRRTVFLANTPTSGEDMTGLLDGRCPECSDSNLLALMIDIPSSVREKLALERQRRTGA
jgi:hypothetical protein